MKTVKSTLIASAGVGALVVGLGVSPASAGLITFTWNPNGTSPPISSLASSEFTGNDLTIADYANIVITPTGSNTATAVETAIFNVTAVNSIGTPGLDSPGTGAYQLYFTVTDDSTLTGSAGDYSGYFTTLTYDLYGVTGDSCVFSASTAGATVAGCGGTPILLAAGNLVPGQVTSGPFATNYSDTSPVAAGAIVSIAEGTPTSSVGSFFVSPPGSQLSGFDFISDFTNNVSNLGGSVPPNDIVINGGGGNVNMLAAPVTVPEPQTLAMFGFGLIGMGWFARRRAKKS
jgi:hypothetical protein